MKLRLTLTCDYDVLPDTYGSPQEIIKLNQEIVNDDPFLILNNNEYTVKVEEIK